MTHTTLATRRPATSTLAAALVTAFSLSACAPAVVAPKTTASPGTTPPSPEGSSGWTHKPGWRTQRFAVAAANPIATQAGYDVLRAGGNAMDAVVAVQMVLGLVEPQSSGIGGGAFMLYDNGKQLQAWDGRETAPASSTEKLFLNAEGKPLAFHDAVVGGRSVGTPGAVRMLENAHRLHGRLPWARLLQPAIRLAEEGFAVSPRLNSLLASEKYLAKNDATAARYFYGADGKPLPVGTVLKNPEYAAVLRLMARQGADALLRGEVAQAIVNKVRNHPTNPGGLTMTDMANYRAKLRQPLCFDYVVAVKTYEICGMPPPSSGALAIGQILGILNHTQAGQLPLHQGLPSADWLHLYTEASRLAFADRGQYVADPDFVQAPGNNWHSLLRPAYLKQRASLIAQGAGAQSMKTATPGQPAALQTAYAPMPQQIEYGTSHISIIDAQGNAVAMTTTIEDQFGARMMVNRGKGLAGGFLLNNELTDFSFAPTDDKGIPIANRVQPGKRPRSSMAPTLVYEKRPDGRRGQLVMSAG
ncbi:MAG: gamma-glutamyltransferase family protein, partial [Brachymonas sp.]|nr:gamma-glutamyltransferase family protein [Brachymonas sp.]